MGAQNKTILVLFLIEALLIGIFGATFGLVAGIGMGYGLSATFGSNSSSESGDNANDGTEEVSTSTTSSDSSLNPVYLAQDMAIVWVISVALSIVAGLFPAWKASRYLPVEALRSQ